MELYEKIKARRLELGLTLEDVGNIVGVGKSTVRKWETGNIADMKRDKIALLSKALKVSPLFIMGIDEEEPQPVISKQESILLSYYSQLNELGKDKLIEHAEDLTHNTKYSNVIELTATTEETDYLMPIAAHNDNINDEQLEKINRDIENILLKKKR
ncbi:helix-turn-helix transcriptional regulator [Niameybacter massiliensis]|uniref:Helix-turn-helix transcriptional regulator n=1 Tax=Holtiella tumoricola TaxID=3018743 RepID=A0AA42DNV8_9FIRM|nr:helix-turn-helix transcriptional regulator [Holtiella tumoricola]MDA3732345.1 helix-turn-helix transcriptional regulator [Holtiella tumoricola]